MSLTWISIVKTHRYISMFSFDLHHEKPIEIVVASTLISIVKKPIEILVSLTLISMVKKPNFDLYGEKTGRDTLALISMVKNP